MFGYDIIGDIHGEFGKLQSLLKKLGYSNKGDAWKPPHGRKAVFVGDLIDRGPQQVEVVKLVRDMVDRGYAHCILGNHEFNAIGHSTLRQEGPEAGQFLRPRTPNKLKQHEAFLRQVGDGSALHKEFVDWFKTLPPTLDLEALRIVHAWWHEPYVELMSTSLAHGRLDGELLERAWTPGTREWIAMDGLTKGLEVALPEGVTFEDHGGITRQMARTKWWSELEPTYANHAILEEAPTSPLPDLALPEDYLGKPISGAPVFIGHYWFDGVPVLQTAKVVCVDYSAAKKGRPLVAYRWSGEQTLSESNFVSATKVA